MILHSEDLNVHDALFCVFFPSFSNFSWFFFEKLVAVADWEGPQSNRLCDGRYPEQGHMAVDGSASQCRHKANTRSSWCSSSWCQWSDLNRGQKTAIEVVATGRIVSQCMASISECFLAAVCGDWRDCICEIDSCVCRFLADSTI